MNPKNCIDWEELLSSYNRRRGKHHATTKEMLQELYDETGSMYRMDEILGVSYTCLNKKMKSEGIKIGPRGKGKPAECLKILKELPKEFIENNTFDVIANKIEYNKFYTREVMRKNGFNYVGKRRSKKDK